MLATNPPRLKRFWLAILLGGPLATVTVTLVALVVGAIGALIFQLSSATDVLERNDLLRGATFAVFMAGFNWYLFYVVWPVTWLVWWLSMRGLVRHRVTAARRYMKRGSIVGVCLVAGVTTIFSVLLSGESLFGGRNLSSLQAIMTGLGGLLTGTFIGALAGLACGAIFVGIVRPAAQIGREIDVSVF